VSVLLHLLFLF